MADPTSPAEKPDWVELPEGKDWKKMSASQRWYYKQGKAKIRRKQKWFYWLKKALVCENCGGDYPPPALEFHHTNDDKNKQVAHIVGTTDSLESLWEEIQKCEVLCANCHRVRHTDPPDHVLR